MKTNLQLLVLLFLLAPGLRAITQPSAGGIVYGPKGAFNISAPKGWKLDPTAGARTVCRASFIRMAPVGRLRSH
jgi:hypothetical protein